MKKTPFWKKMWLSITRKDMNEGLEKASALNKAMTLGDFIIHTPSGSRGILKTVEKIGGKEVLSFFDNSRNMIVRGVARQECRLANSERYGRY